MLVATEPRDCRDTPRWVVDAFLNNFQLPTDHVIEPFAGRGRFVDRLVAHGYKTTAVEVRPTMQPLIERYDATLFMGNWIDYLQSLRTANVDLSRISLVSNPPFSVAWEMVNICKKAGFRCIAFLLTLNFFASKKRHAWWKENPVTDLRILSRRPSYDGTGATDTRDYAFFVWEQGRPPLWIDFLLPLDYPTKTQG